MRSLLPALALGACLLSLPALAEDRYLGTLTSTGASVNNSTTAVPFTVPSGSGVKLAAQCDAAANVRSGSTGSSLVVTTTAGPNKGPLMAVNALMDIPFNSASNAVAAVAVAGTANCDIYVVTP